MSERRVITDDEKMERAMELARVHLELVSAKGEWKVVSGQYRERIARLEERRNELALDVTTGTTEPEQQEML